MPTSKRARPRRLATGFVPAIATSMLLGTQLHTQQPAPSSQTKPALDVTAVTDSGWPRNIVSGATTITVYQPQLDEWDGFHLTGRAAVAVKEKSSETPTYGIVQVAAHANVDKQNRIVTLDKLDVTSASFPKAADKTQQWISIIEAHATTLKPIALDRLEAMIASSSAQQQSQSTPVRNDPPKMIFSTVPAMLLPIDGEPVFRDVEGTSLSRVLNTRPLILRDKAGKVYLKIFDGWMSAPALTGAWTVAATVPADCDKALKAAIDAKTADLLVGGDPNEPSTAPSLEKGPVPHIYVETKPAELIVTDGAPKFAPIEGTALLYAENTTGNLFMNTGDQRAYALVSGRWFAGPSSLAGPWAFVAGESLPEDFKKIPDASAKENVKASVAGTSQAEEAVVANSIPQTAKVKRSDAKFAPTFDGQPKYTTVEGTSLQYVENSSLPIIVVPGGAVQYFGLQNGVWFVAPVITGPWVVATVIPSVIYSIPATSPLYYVTYVRVYDSDPTYVIVGYTPGYYGSYVSSGVVVYGTGYVYRPWIGTYWWGPPVTYGFGATVVYTPWMGWHVAYGFGWAWGVATAMALGWGWGPYPWWGPSAFVWRTTYPWVYRPGAGVAWGPRGAVAWGPGYWAGTTGNVYSRWGSRTAVTRTSGGFDAWTGNRWAGQVGASYNSRTGTLAAGQRGAVANVYTGNYAAGKSGAAVNTRTGVTVSGGEVTAGNARTGQKVTAGKATVQGPGGRDATISGVKTNEGFAIKGDNNTYAGHDGNVYRHTDAGGWQKHTDDGWQPVNRQGGAGITADQQRRLDADRQARVSGETRAGGYQRGSYRTARPRSGGARRR